MAEQIQEWSITNKGRGKAANGSGAEPSSESQFPRLRVWQKVFLQLIAEENAPLTKGYILRVAEDRYGEVKYDYIFTHAVGVPDAEILKRKERRLGYPSLITLGYVSCYYIWIEGTRTPVYEITTTGKEAASRYKSLEFRRRRWANHPSHSGTGPSKLATGTEVSSYYDGPSPHSGVEGG